MPVQPNPVIAYRFGPFRLSLADQILERGGQRVLLTPKVFDTLRVLVETSPQVVTKEALMEAVWPGVNVVESGLTRNISVLRKALEEGFPDGTFIETIPRRGYRFIAEVTPETNTPAPANEPEPEASAPETPPLAPQPSSKQAPKRWGRLILIPLAVIAVLWIVLPKFAPPPPADPEIQVAEHLLRKVAPKETLRALDHFERAAAAHPNSADAHAGIAVALFQLVGLGVRTLPDVREPAEAATRKALELKSSHLALYAASQLALFRDGDFTTASAYARQAIRLKSDSVIYLHGYSLLKSFEGDTAEALNLIEQALRLDPASPLLGTQYCRLFYLGGDFHRAEAECRKVLDREAGYALAHYYLALSLGFLNRFDEARRALDDSKLQPGTLDADRAWLSLRQGDRRPALEVLDNRRRLVEKGSIHPMAKLLLAANLGLMDEAFQSLEAGLAVRDQDLFGVHADPRLAALRNDPRYPSISLRIGVPAR